MKRNDRNALTGPYYTSHVIAPGYTVLSYFSKQIYVLHERIAAGHLTVSDWGLYTYQEFRHMRGGYSVTGTPGSMQPGMRYSRPMMTSSEDKETITSTLGVFSENHTVLVDECYDYNSWLRQAASDLDVDIFDYQEPDSFL